MTSIFLVYSKFLLQFLKVLKFNKKESFYLTKINFIKLNLFTIFEVKLINNKMNKNTVLAWATYIMIFVGLGLIALGAFRYNEIAGWGFAAVGIGFFAIAWVFNALKGRV